VRLFEDLREFHADGRQVIDVEEAPVVDLVGATRQKAGRYA